MLREFFNRGLEEGSHQPPEMVQTELLRDIAQSLPHIQPNYERLINVFENTEDYSNMRLEVNRTISRLMEIQLNLSLQEVIDISQLGDRIELNPSIPHTPNYRFEIDPLGGSRIQNKSSRTYEAELDGLLVIDRQPVIFETKLTGYDESMKPEKKLRLGKYLSEFMKPARLKKIADPLKEAFNTENVGFVFVFPQDTYMDSGQSNFINRGGLITYMPFTKEEFQHRVYSLRPKYRENNRDNFDYLRYGID